MDNIFKVIKFLKEYLAQTQMLRKLTWNLDLGRNDNQNIKYVITEYWILNKIRTINLLNSNF